MDILNIQRIFRHNCFYIWQKYLPEPNFEITLLTYFVCLLITYLFLCILGCHTNWDGIWCWNRAEVGQVVNVSCSEVSQLFATNQGKLYLSHFFYYGCYQYQWGRHF